MVAVRSCGTVVTSRTGTVDCSVIKFVIVAFVVGGSKVDVEVVNWVCLVVAAVVAVRSWGIVVTSSTFTVSCSTITFVMVALVVGGSNVEVEVQYWVCSVVTAVVAVRSCGMVVTSSTRTVSCAVKTFVIVFLVVGGSKVDVTV